MESKYGKGTLILLIAIGIVLGFGAGILFFNIIVQGTITFHLQFGWNSGLTFFSVCFSIVGAGLGWTVWRSLSRGNVNAPLPRWITVIIFVVIGLVLLFLWSVWASLSILFHGS